MRHSRLVKRVKGVFVLCVSMSLTGCVQSRLPLVTDAEQTEEYHFSGEYVFKNVQGGYLNFFPTLNGKAPIEIFNIYNKDKNYLFVERSSIALVGRIGKLEGLKIVQFWSVGDPQKRYQYLLLVETGAEMRLAIMECADGQKSCAISSREELLQSAVYTGSLYDKEPQRAIIVEPYRH